MIQPGPLESRSQVNPSCEVTGFRHISEVVDEANKEIDDFRKGLRRPLITFSAKLNNAIGGLYPADQVIIAARTGVGKSAFANILIKSIFDLNPQSKLVVFYWSLEMPNRQQVLRLYSNKFHMPVKRIVTNRNPVSDQLFDEMVTFGEALSNYNIYFRDLPTDLNLFMKVMETVHKQFPGFQIINLFDHTRLIRKTNEKSEEEKITALMEKGVECKNKWGDINIFISQMNRNIEGANKNGRLDIGASPPLLSDIWGADSTSQFATLIICLHRPELYGKPVYKPYENLPEISAIDLIACHVLKQRDGWTGMIPMKHNLSVYRIEDMPTI